MKQFHWLLCVAKSCDWSKKITPLSNLTRAWFPVEPKLTAKVELDCEMWKILKKMQWKLSQFLSSEQPCEAKSFNVALKFAGLEKIPSEKFEFAVNLEAIWFEFFSLIGLGLKYIKVPKSLKEKIFGAKKFFPKGQPYHIWSRQSHKPKRQYLTGGHFHFAWRSSVCSFFC